VTLVLIIGLGLLASAVALIARAVMSPPRTSESLEQIGAYGFSGKVVDTGGEGGRRRALDDLANTLGEFMARRIGTARENELRQKLVQAGMYTTGPRKFVGYQLLLTIALPVVWLWFSGLLATNGALVVFGLVFAGVIGWIAPLSFLSRKIRFRQDQIDYELPELIDLLVVSVEAGVGFSGSLRIAAERLTGPLGQELRLTMQEQNMGLSTTEALKNLLVRAETPGVRSFVRSVTQGETLGVSIGQIMRNLAGEMRKRRKAAAEEKAQKAPIKMLFPLIFLIFPAMFVVLLIPAFINFFRAIG
jgi:tight adherence protein C